jgi:thymidylate synthase (FAD)
MKARLFSYTQPTEELRGEFKSALELIAYCTKVSNPAGQYKLDNSERLIRRLIEWKHWSPLEMADATIEIETTRDIARQLIRHRSFVFQEFSQRYGDPNDLDDTFVLREARLQDPKNRQNSIETTDEKLKKTWNAKQQQIIHEAKMAYNWAIANGIAKEQARVVLPEGNTISKLYMKGSLRSWIHYIELRSGNGTQKEHMEVARAIAEAITAIFPMAGEYVHGQENKDSLS